MKKFDFNNNALRNQFDNIKYLENSGVSKEEMLNFYNNLMKCDNTISHDVLKAELFDYILTNGKIAIDVEDIFQDKVFDANLISMQRNKWINDIKDGPLYDLFIEEKTFYENGSYSAHEDLGHTSPNTKTLLKLGFIGLLERVEKYEKDKTLTKEQEDFYKSCKIVLNACIKIALRLSNAIQPYNKENAIALKNIATSAPKNTYEAMQLIVLYFFMHEYVYKTRVRTLGRLDVLLYPFYINDIKNNVFTKDEIIEMLKYFLNKFSSAKVPFGLPFAIGGLDENENEITNELSYIIVKVYEEMDIYSPKIHVRVSSKTPKDFIKIVLNSIRNGKSSFVFVNDEVTVKALTNVGIEKQDALDYVPIGCYEPAVWGKEIGCTGNGGVNLVKALEYTLSGGYDATTGDFCTFKPAKLDTFEDFCNSVKEQILYLTDKAVNYINELEKYYGYFGPDTMLSVQYDDSVINGIDVMKGGAKYNNTSLYYYSIATLVDSLTAVKELVYDKKALTISQLYEVLKNNWQGNEVLRKKMLKSPNKYGNENELADSLTVDFSNYCSKILINRKNNRGGVYKPALFTIDFCFYYGSKTFATPDGRLRGEPLSKNLCASIAMDKNGVLSLINSVTKIDFTGYPTGSVLDILLHPSAVKGEDGLNAFYGILKTYLDKGGFALHGNVFNVEDLKNAQLYPEKYSTLQVRVCGWNVYFIDLTKEEQDAFIKQAEHIN